jgi:signal transduction histidine kinase
MEASAVRSRIPGDISWGAHLCQFYETTRDLADIVIPYLRAGLEKGEKCAWIAADTFPADAMRDRLRAVVPGVDALEANGQLTLTTPEAWYLSAGGFTADGPLRRLVEAEEEAIRCGYPGLRAGATLAWLEDGRLWDAFAEYELKVTRAIQGRRIKALCSYPVRRCGVREVFDVLQSHDCGIIDMSSFKAAKEQVQSVRGAEAQAFEAERKRAETLAEIDRAKTAFFSNVSHEFRTPLTLALGPLENLLAMRDGSLSPDVREQLAVAHRNCVRLMKLVNGLLDFSRIESNRAQPRYEATDLARLTAELASCFRSACEEGGVRLLVDCPPLPDAVQVDRSMWEKIVLNLISNAFKFTLEGEIEVKLRAAGSSCELTVRDTGTGIPDAELPRIFERFHRVEATEGRSLEGTGIGLAMVQELVRLLSGSVGVQSAPGRGSTFTVTVPIGTAHLAPDPIVSVRGLGSTGVNARSYVEEALSWVAGDAVEREAVDAVLPLPLLNLERPPQERAGQEPGPERPRVLWADDNSDMREYVRRLLAPHYEVESVSEGLAALEAARRRRPSLVLADVMMPRLDGFGLLRQLRADPALRTVPVVLLTARAGADSSAQGLESGADDYVVKPFSARELLARVRTHIEQARLREEAERTAALREENHRKDEFLAMLSHELRNPLAAIRNAASILDRGEPGGEHARRAKEILGRQLDHLTRLVNDLLDVTRIARGKIRLERSRVELGDIVRRAVQDHSLGFAERGIALELRTDGLPLWIEADQTRILQALGNLLQNASKFTNRGGHVVVSIGQEEGGRAVIRVADDGVGIAPDLLPRMFQPFVQAEEELDRGRGGLGLGLALVKGVVDLHGGTAEARSDGAGRGAEVTIRLLCLPEQPGRPLPRRATDKACSKRVLVIDDNTDTAESLRLMLSLEGHEVEEAHDGPSGIEKARSFAPDVILCDIGLPGMNGYEVARMIRADPILASSVLVAVTGYTLPDDKRKAADAGFDHHLGKPITVEQLEPLLAPSRPSAATTSRRDG